MDKPFNLHHTYASQGNYATRHIFGSAAEHTIRMKPLKNSLLWDIQKKK